MVESIECFGPELERVPIVECHAVDRCEVGREKPRPATKRARSVSEGVGGILFKSRRVEPLGQLLLLRPAAGEVIRVSDEIRAHSV